LGAALARRYAREGLTVAITSRSPEQLERIAHEIRAAGGTAHALPGDASSEADVQALEARLAQLGALRAAVYNAAAGHRAPSLELSAQQFEESWRVSTLGGFLVGRAALRLQLPHGRGSLIFTGATASLRGRPPFAAFASAKAGLRSLSQSLAREFGPKGIHVAHVVIDGGIDGERLRTKNPQRVAELGEDGLLAPDAIADVYWQLHTQARSTWTQELDLRPYKEPF
jgi:NAD(P)-dependent dehydrogenase (short-subunit alcohol dehydrogenase family)